MNSQSDLRLGSTMLFVGTLICGGFAVAALYPVAKNTTWRELLSPDPAATVSSASNTDTTELSGGVSQQQHAALAAQTQQRLAQKRRLAEQELLRKRMGQQQAARRHATNARAVSQRRTGGEVTTTTNGQRTTRSIERPISGGTMRDHASSDAQRNEVYVPVNVHPVTVNVDGSAMSGEVARLADGINQVLTAQREALRSQQQAPPAQLQPVIVQALPQQILQSAMAAPAVSDEERQRLEKIDSTLRELAGAFDSLRAETRTAVAGISQDVTHAQASQIEVTSQLLAEYRLAIEQQQQLMRRHEEDVTARIRLESLPPLPAPPVPKEIIREVVIVQQAEAAPQPVPEAAAPAPKPPVEIVEVNPAPKLVDEAPADEPIAVELGHAESRLLRIPDPPLAEEQPDVDFAEFETQETDGDELESWIADNAENSIEEQVKEFIEESLVVERGPWDLDNPVVETDVEPEFDAWVARHYEPRRMNWNPAAIAQAQQRRVQAVAYEQTYRFPMASAEHTGRQVRHAVGHHENCEVCRRPHAQQGQRQSYQQRQQHVRPQQQRSQQQRQQYPGQRPQAHRPQNPAVIQQTAAVAAQPTQAQVRRPAPGTAMQQPVRKPVAGSDGGIFAELGYNVRQGANQLARVVAGPNPNVKPSRTNAQGNPRLMHRMKSSLRNMGGSPSAE